MDVFVNKKLLLTVCIFLPSHTTTKLSCELIIEFNTKPIIELDNYLETIPDFEEPKVSKKEITKRIKDLAKNEAELKKVEDRDTVIKNDFVSIDFDGYIDDKALNIQDIII